MTLTRRLTLVMVVVLLVAGTFPVQRVDAATLDVCPSGCTYSSVQAALDASAAGDTINVRAGTYVEHLTIDHDVTIVGEGAASTTIDGNGNGTTVTIGSGATVVMTDLGVTNGFTTGNGGGIINAGTLTVERVDVFDNTAEDGGGGIFNGASLTVVDATITGNQAMTTGTGGIGGGGIANGGTSAIAHIENTTITGNSAVRPGTDSRGGGGVASKSGDLTIEDSLIANNESGYAAGGIHVSGTSASFTLTRSTVSGNVNGTDRGVGSGGGMLLRGASVEIIDSTISDNVSLSGGGGISSDASTKVVNSTISGNQAAGAGGGIDTDRSIAISSLTVVGNTAKYGGGIYAPGTVIDSVDSILANNAATDVGDDCYGTFFVDAGRVSLLENTNDCSVSGTGTVITGVDPQLGARTDNGGPTETHLPQAGSPVIDAGATTLTADQRGEPRPSGAAPDLGSVEVQQTAVDTTPPTWIDATLIANGITASGFTVEWSGATDEVGVDSYEVLLDGTVVETVPAPQTSTAISGLAPGTTYTIEVQAYDAAGNRSTDGPTTNVTTSPDLPDGHIGPDLEGESTLEWLDDLPYSPIDEARSNGEIVVVASQGPNSPVVRSVGIGAPATFDVDGDGSDDLSASVDLDISGVGPVPSLSVDRLGPAPGPSDVEVLAFVPDELLNLVLPDAGGLFLGFRTAMPDGSPGGWLPENETISFQIDQVEGTTHNIQVDYETTNRDPDSGLRFVTGHFEGNRGGAARGDMASALLDIPPEWVRMALSIDFEALDRSDDSEILMRWEHSDPGPRPIVTFQYLEDEDAIGKTDYEAQAYVHRMPSVENLRIIANDADDELQVRHDGSSGIGEVIAEFRRRDGLELRGGFLNVQNRLWITVSDDVVINNPEYTGTGIDLIFEAHRPAGLLAGPFTNPIRDVFVRVDDVKDEQIIIGNARILSSGIRISGPGDELTGEVTFVAADDIGDLRFRDGQSWPTGAPETWGTLPYDPGFDKAGRISVYDGPAATTVAARFTEEFPSVEVGLEPTSLRNLFALDGRGSWRLVAGFQTEQGSAMGGSALEVDCEASGNWGSAQFDVAPPSSYSWDATDMKQVLCSGQRDGFTFDFEAGPGDDGNGLLPDQTEITLDLSQDDGGSFSIDSDDEFDPPVIDALDVLLRHEDRLIGDAFLGQPVREVALRAEKVEDFEGSWHRDELGQTVVGFESTADEVQPELLAFAMSGGPTAPSEEAPDATPISPPSPTALRNRVDGATHELLLWEGFVNRFVVSLQSPAYLDAIFNQDGSIAASTDLDGPDDNVLGTSLLFRENGHFSESLSLDLGCGLMMTGQTDGFEFTPPSSLQFETTRLGGFEAASCDARIRSEVSDFSADVEFDGEGITSGTELSFDGVSGFDAEVPGEEVAALSFSVVDRGLGIPGHPVLFDEGITAVSLQASDVPSFAATLPTDADSGSFELQAKNPARPIGNVQTRIGTGPVPATDSVSIHPDPSSGTYVGVCQIEYDGWVFDKDLPCDTPRESGDLQDVIHLASSQVRRLFADLDRSGGGIELHVESDSSQDLQGRVRQDHGGDLLNGVICLWRSSDPCPELYEADITVGGTGMSANLTLRTDFAGWFRIDGFTETEAITLDGSATAVPSGENDPRIPVDFALRAEGIPRRVTIDVPEDRITPTHPVDAVDVVLVDPRPDGILNGELDRIRIRAEGVPAIWLDFDQLDAGSVELPDELPPFDGRIPETMAGTSTTPSPAMGRVGDIYLVQDDVTLHGPKGFQEWPADTLTLPSPGTRIEFAEGKPDHADDGSVVLVPAGRTYAVHVFVDGRSTNAGTISVPDGIPMWPDADTGELFTEASAVLEGVLDIGAVAGGSVDRLLVEATRDSDPGLFGTPFRSLSIDLTDVPEVWRLDISADGNLIGGPDDSPVFDGSASASLVTEDATGNPASIGTASVLISKDASVANPRAYEFFGGVTDAIERTHFLENVDENIFPTGVEAALSQLYSPIPTLESTRLVRPSAPDGRGGVEVTRATQDHFILSGPSRTPSFLSLRVSGISSIIGAYDGETSEFDLQRETQAQDEPFFVGFTEGSNYIGYDDRLPEIEPPAGDDGGPVVDDEWKRVEPGETVTINVLKGDEPESDQPEECKKEPAESCVQLDPSTLTVIPLATTNGGLSVTEENLVEYTPGDPDFRGSDQFWYGICNTAGKCATGYVEVFVSQAYRDITVFELEDQPESAHATLRYLSTGSIAGGVVPHVLDEVEITTEGLDGGLDYYSGPDRDLDATAVADKPEQVRVVVADLPDEMVLTGLSDIPSGQQFRNKGVAALLQGGKVKVDTSEVVDLYMLVQEGEKRTAVGLRGEDLEISVEKKGVLVDDPTNNTTTFDDFQECDTIRLFGKKITGTCLRLFRLALEVEAVGDETNKPVSGFVASYKHTELVNSNSSDFVPRLTLMLDDVRDAFAFFEFQADPFKCLTSACLDLEFGTRLRSADMDLRYWDLGGFNGSFSYLNETFNLLPGDDPDYASFTPWVIVSDDFDPLAP